jgi:TatD DNase family protein
MAQKGVDVRATLDEARASGLAALIDVGISPDDLPERAKQLSAYPWVHLTSGLHPTSITHGNADSLLELLGEQAESGSVVAIGETGLDYHWDTGERHDQHRLFAAQASIAAARDLPVIVHNREANDDVLAILRERRPRGVMHCFSQDATFCRKCLDLGLFVSFGGNLTFRTSDTIRDAAAMVPDEFLLVETDSPYLSPEPVRGRPNHPGHLGFTLEALASVRGTDAEHLARLCAENAARLFGIASDR